MIHCSRFTASDENGHRYIIYVAQGDHEERGCLADGGMKMWTAAERLVNRVDQGVYEMVDGDCLIRLISNDPKAP